MITYYIATIIDERNREKEKEEYGDDFFDTSKEERRKDRIAMAALWPIAVIFSIVAGLFELIFSFIFSGSAKICDKIIQKKKGGETMNNNITLINPERRKKNQFRCHFCESTMPVKYMVNIFDPVVSEKPTRVTCCNKCAAMFGKGKDK